MYSAEALSRHISPGVCVIPLDRAVHFDFFGPNGPSGTPEDIFARYQIFGPPGDSPGTPKGPKMDPKWLKIKNFNLSVKQF